MAPKTKTKPKAKKKARAESDGSNTEGSNTSGESSPEPSGAGEEEELEDLPEVDKDAAEVEELTNMLQGGKDYRTAHPIADGQNAPKKVSDDPRGESVARLVKIITDAGEGVQVRSLHALRQLVTDDSYSVRRSCVHGYPSRV